MADTSVGVDFTICCSYNENSDDKIFLHESKVKSAAILIEDLNWKWILENYGHPMSERAVRDIPDLRDKHNGGIQFLFVIFRIVP